MITLFIFEQLARRDFSQSPHQYIFTHPERQVEHWWCKQRFSGECVGRYFFKCYGPRLTSESELCFILCSVFRALNEMC